MGQTLHVGYKYLKNVLKIYDEVLLNTNYSTMYGLNTWITVPLSSVVITKWYRFYVHIYWQKKKIFSIENVVL